jgi:hypothetical protein
MAPTAAAVRERVVDAAVAVVAEVGPTTAAFPTTAKVTAAAATATAATAVAAAAAAMAAAVAAVVSMVRDPKVMPSVSQGCPGVRL